MTKAEIEFQCELAYGEKFLELIGKKVGDKVKCRFFYSSGTAKQSYTESTVDTGTIILDEKGYAVISDNEYLHSMEVRKKPWNVSDFSTYWKYESRHSRSELKYIILQ